MLIKSLKVALIGAGMLTMAFAPQARAWWTTVNVNIYGSYQQYWYWKAMADEFCASEGYMIVGERNILSSPEGLHGIVVCEKGSGSDQTRLIIRYSHGSIGMGPSVDAIYAATKTNAPTFCDDPCCRSGPGLDYRNMITSLDDTSLSCQKVTIGASDIAGPCFTQITHGDSNGCRSGGKEKHLNLDNHVVDWWPEDLGQVIPYGFFANTDALPNLTNLTQAQAGIIFSGTLTNWSDFAGGGNNATDEFPNAYVVACMRHAGSAVHAALERDIMEPARQLLAQTEQPPIVQFNDTGSDMMLCIRNNGYTGAGQECEVPGMKFGAIGYAYCAHEGFCVDYPCRMLTYEGKACTKDNLINGVYPFWSYGAFYINNSSGDEVIAFARKVVEFAQHNNVTGVIGAEYLVKESEMRVTKPNACGGPILPKYGSGWGDY